MPTGVTFTGLTKLVSDLKRAKVVWPKEADKLTKKVGNEMLAFYQSNLSGSRPSTTAVPLPVGVVTGDLLEGAKMKQVNQFRTDVINDDFKAAWIEFGTSKMTPRRPLGAAVEEYTGGDFPNDANEVLPKVFK